MSCYGPLVNVSSSGLSQKHETMVHWLLAAISLTVSPFTITLNALVIIAVTQRKELQKRSNILLSSIALADFLTGIASIPAVTTSLVTVHEASLKLVCTINRVALSLEDFLRFCSLYVPSDHGCMGKVRSHREIHGLQGNYDKIVSYQDCNLRLVVGDFYMAAFVHYVNNKRGS